MTAAVRLTTQEAAALEVRGEVLELAAVSPASRGRTPLVLVDGGGRRVAAQRIDDPSRLVEVAAATEAASGRPVVTRPERGLLLHPPGADRRLLGLPALLAQPGAALLAHRPERRAVVRRADGRYAKAVLPSRIAGLLARVAAVAGVDGLDTAALHGVDADRGVIVFDALPGRTLHDLLAEPDLAAAAAAVGRAVRALAAAPAPASLEVHDAAREEAVLDRWSAAAAIHAPALAERAAALLPAVRAGLREPASPSGLVHRDLFDKQLLVDGGRVGVVDLDTAAVGEPALDLANLLVHLELRVLQGRLGAAGAAAAASALLEQADPPASTVARLGAYAAAARLRLALVYGLRPPQAALAEPLLASVREGLAGLTQARPGR